MESIKSQILSLATLRMQQVGIRSVSVDDLCHELGISKKTFYVHFPSKDDLVEAILREQETKLANDVLHIVEKKSIVQCIVDWTAIAKKTEQCRQEAPPLLYDLQKYYPTLHKNHRNRISSFMRDFLVQFLQKGQNEGIFRDGIDAEITAMLFVNTHIQMVEYAESNHLSPTEVRYLNRVHMDILLRGIFTQEGLKTLEDKVKREN